MNEPDYFEEMLATYPADRRELARKVYARFAEGDSTQFFSQLLLVLDVYAQYLRHVPQKVVAANVDTLATIQEAREEITLMAKTIEARDLNITNHAAKTDELCKITQAKCNETIAGIELLVKNLGSQVDTKTIVRGIETAIKDIFLPLKVRADSLAHAVEPTLEKLNAASERAAQLWPQHVWRTAWVTAFFSTLTVFGLITVGIYKHFDTYAERQAAEKIAEVSQVMNYNQDAFRQLAVARVSLKVERTQSDGLLNPQTFVLIVPDADLAEVRHQDGHDNGCIFVTSHVPEEQIQRLQQGTAKAEAAKGQAK
jgi:hypothetical protein